MIVRLTQLDGKLPNIALARLAAYWRARGADIYFTTSPTRKLDEPRRYEAVYGSAIFAFSARTVRNFQSQFPEAIVGGTWNPADNRTLEDLPGFEDCGMDYSLWPDFTGSIGFTQRGCRLKCGFCVVPKKEGRNHSTATLNDIWRGALTAQDEVMLHDRRNRLTKPEEAAAKQEVDQILQKHEWPRHLHLLDNDFFGQPREQYEARLAEIRSASFKICLNQGINVRMIDDVSAAALASVDYRDDSFTAKRIYTAWDNIGDEKRFFDGIATLAKYGIPPSHVMAYMLIGYDKRETWERLFYRYDRMAALGIRVYPMVFDPKPNRYKQLPAGAPLYDVLVKRKMTLGQFQRWVNGRYYMVSSFAEYRRTTEPLSLREEQMALTL